jgi:hypothetical protein
MGRKPVVLDPFMLLRLDRVHPEYVDEFGSVGGTFAAFAILSLALSVSVRVRMAEFDRAAAWWIADPVGNGAVVAVCDVDEWSSNPLPRRIPPPRVSLRMGLLDPVLHGPRGDHPAE